MRRNNRWILGICLLAVMLTPCPANAADGSVETGLSGTAQWPCMRGMQWSMHKEVVLLLEEANGLTFSETVDGVYTAADVPAFGKEARLTYVFSDACGLEEAEYVFAFDGLDEALRFVEDARDALCAQYGAALEESEIAASDVRESVVSERAVWGTPPLSTEGKSTFLFASVSLGVTKSDGRWLVSVLTSGSWRVAQ